MLHGYLLFFSLNLVELPLFGFEWTLRQPRRNGTRRSVRPTESTVFWKPMSTPVWPGPHIPTDHQNFIFFEYSEYWSFVEMGYPRVALFFATQMVMTWMMQRHFHLHWAFGNDNPHVSMHAVDSLNFG